MTKSSFAQFCAIAAVVTLPSLSFAGTPAKCKDKKCCDKPAQSLSESAFAADLGVNVVTSYYRRGVLITKHSASIQPYVDVAFTAYKGDGFLNKATFGLGLWQSYTNPASVKPNVGNNQSLTQQDITPSLALTFGNFTLTESYLFLNFPNTAISGPGGVRDAQGVSSKLSYDDTDLLGALALHPSFTWVKELDGKIGSSANTFGGNAVKDKQGSYYEVAVAPSTTAGPVTVTLPVVAAFGSNGFYAKDGYGYLSAGLNLGYALPVAKRYGNWIANAGATYYNLNKSAVGSTADNDLVGSFGLGVAF
jgi:hypothetical protein